MPPALRKSRHNILFVLAYVAIAGLVLFARPFGDAPHRDTAAVALPVSASR